MKDTRYELIKGTGIYVTDADDFPMNHGVRLDMSRFKTEVPQNEMSLFYAMYKVANTRWWNVRWVKFDDSNVSFVYCCDAKDDVEYRTLSYDDVCDFYHWKKWNVSDDKQRIIFERDDAWYERMQKACDEYERAKRRAAKKLEKA